MPTLAAWRTDKQQNRNSTKISQWYPEPFPAIRQWKTRLVPETPAGYPPPPLLPLSGGSKCSGWGFCISRASLGDQGSEANPEGMRRCTFFRTSAGGRSANLQRSDPFSRLRRQLPLVTKGSPCIVQPRRCAHSPAKVTDASTAFLPSGLPTASRVRSAVCRR